MAFCGICDRQDGLTDARLLLVNAQSCSPPIGQPWRHGGKLSRYPRTQTELGWLIDLRHKQHVILSVLFPHIIDVWKIL